METSIDSTREDSKGERGAALVTALLISSMLLLLVVGLLVEAVSNASNVTDATSEIQAYYAAESGIQSAIYVLRDNVTLSDANRIDATKPATDRTNRIDYLKALNVSDSNLANGTDPLDGVPRLSRWLPYSGAAPDRIAMGGGLYNALTGYAYKLEISDPDNTGSQVTYSTSGRLSSSDSLDVTQKTYGDGSNGFVIRYVPQSATQVNTTGGTGNANFGEFTITKYGNGAAIPSHNRFEIVVSMSLPYAATRVLRGYIMMNSCSSSCTMPGIIMDSRTFTLSGSEIDLTAVGGNPLSTTYVEGPPAGFSSSFDPISTPASPSSNIVSGVISPPEPIRLRIRSTGYGPRGATKQLEAIIQKNFFNGVTGPATLTLVGPPATAACPSCIPAQPATTITFNPGSSNVADYSGQDEDSTDIIPPIGTTNTATLETVSDSIDGLPPHPFNGDVVGVPSDISVEITSTNWLYSPSTVDSTVKSFYPLARDTHRYFPRGTQPSTFGDNASGTGITICDGSCEFTGAGGGILIVTGTLTLKGNFSFRGMIIVTGQGGVRRAGAGNGEIFGNIIIAPYVNSGIAPASEPVGTSFLAPQYDLSGGGNSTIAYSSGAVGTGLLAVDNFVLGIVEK